MREHAAKAVDYSIRVALISIIALPVGFCAWWFIGFRPGGDSRELNPVADRISQVIGISGFIFLSPAYVSAKLLELAHVPSDPLFGLLYFVAGIISVPTFWGTLIYLLVQYRHMRLRFQYL